MWEPSPVLSGSHYPATAFLLLKSQSRFPGPTCSAWPSGFSSVVRFSSVVPLVSRICPNDVCRIWKSGAKLRVDITLLGFENMSWIRGRRSFIFKGEGEWFCSIFIITAHAKLQTAFWPSKCVYIPILYLTLSGALFFFSFFGYSC